jgi:hypothetical protein
VGFTELKFSEYSNTRHCLHRPLAGTRKDIHQIWDFTKCMTTKLGCPCYFNFYSSLHGTDKAPCPDTTGPVISVKYENKNDTTLNDSPRSPQYMPKLHTTQIWLLLKWWMWHTTFACKNFIHDSWPYNWKSFQWALDMQYARHNRLEWRRIRADAGKKCNSGVGAKHSYKTALSN